jgi:hypothetical protein
MTKTNAFRNFTAGYSLAMIVSAAQFGDWQWALFGVSGGAAFWVAAPVLFSEARR